MADLQDQKRVNRLIARIDELRAKMDSFGRTYDQVMQFSQKDRIETIRARPASESGEAGRNRTPEMATGPGHGKRRGRRCRGAVVYRKHG